MRLPTGGVGRAGEDTADWDAEPAEQPELRATIEIATIAGQPRLRGGDVNGRIVEWIENGILIGVWDFNALSDDSFERVVAGVAFHSPGEAWAAQRAASDHIATMPAKAATEIGSETLELRRLDQAGARALCAVDRSDVRRCRLHHGAVGEL